jgi:hypothetical protein
MSTDTIKLFFGVLSVIPAVIAYALYFRKMYTGTVKPHAFSWLIWGLLAANGCIAQVSAHAGFGAWTTGLTAVACLLIFFIAIFNGILKPTRLDWILLTLAIISFLLLFIVDDKTVALYLTLFATLLGFSMTIKKAWHKPHEEAPISFGLNAIKFLPAIFALQSYSFLTVAYPITAGIANAAVVFVILIRTASKRNTGF